jgi:methionyl-tRNA formyltransferase
MIQTLTGLMAGTIRPRPQDHAKATAAPILKKEDGRIDFHRTARETCNRLRGFQPWPGAFTSFRKKNLNVWAAQPLDKELAEGQIAIEVDRLIVGCGGSTALELQEVQPEGKKRMAARDFVHGYHPQPGEQMGS